MGRSLLVTGDDFGARVRVNAAIGRAHREGILTGASLMVTGAAVEDAVERARALPRLATGLHLVLCDGRAASPPQQIPDLVDEQGRFPESPLMAGLRHWFRRHHLRDQLEREIRAQVERYLETGLPLDHLDSHHHLHMHPVIFDRLLAVLSEYRIPWIRLVHEDARARRPRRGGSETAARGAALGAELVAHTFGILARRHRRRLRALPRLGFPERVYGLRESGRVGSEWLLWLIPRLRAATVELYAHPDEDDARGRREAEALRSLAVRRAVVAAGYRLESSRSLADASLRRSA